MAQVCQGYRGVHMCVLGIYAGIYERGLSSTKRNFKVASLVWCHLGLYPEQGTEMDQEEHAPGTGVLSQAAPSTPCEMGEGWWGDPEVSS